MREYAARAAKSLDQHHADAAWRDLLAAEALNTGEKVVAELRQTLARLGLVQARAALEAGEPSDAIAVVGRLRDRGVRHPDLVRLEEAAQDWSLAAELADRGDFLRACAELDRLRPRLPCPTAAFDRVRTAIDDRHARFRSAVSQLYDAAESRRWREALAAADAVLAVAPDHREAKAIRGKAWLAAAPATADYRGAADGLAGSTPEYRDADASRGAASVHVSVGSAAGMRSNAGAVPAGRCVAPAVPAMGRWRGRVSRVPVEPRQLRPGHE